MKLLTKLCSSLAKVMPAQTDKDFIPYASAAALQGETFSFQLAYRMEEVLGGAIQLNVQGGELSKHIRVRTVELAPVRFTAFSHDDDIISKDPGLYPDILKEYSGSFRIPTDQWRTFWIDVKIP